MPMPKNHRMSRNYAGVFDDPDALDFRTIAKRMGEIGYPMGHSSVRNYLLRALKKLARAIATHYGENISEKEIDIIIKSEVFQTAIRKFVQDAVAASNLKKE